jgi:RimJ/RimL family protein N-acetyltransferase
MLKFVSKKLIGQRLQLEPLDVSHQQELYDAAQDEKIWTYNGSKALGEKFYRWFDKALDGLAKKNQLPFVVRRKSDQKILGGTRFYDIDADHHRMTIGYTWYIPEVWGSYVNPESKFLLLSLAFEEMNANRIQFFMDSRNERSAAAIKKLGAQQEGIFRQHMVLEDGYLRDTIVFSIIKPEWPPVKASLQKRLENL